MVRSTRGWALAVLMLGAAGCGGEELTPPTTPTPDPITRTFTGALSINGAVTHPFTTQAGGTVIATLSAIDPAVTAGLSLGTWNGLSCHIIIPNDQAVAPTSVTGTVAATGDLCVRIYDVGRFTGSTTYTLSVLHP